MTLTALFRSIPVLAGLVLLTVHSTPVWAAPEVRAESVELTARVAEPVDVAYVVSWPEAASRYAILPPPEPEIEGAEARWSVAESRNVESGAEMRYVLRVVPGREGEFRVPPLEFGYFDPEGAADVAIDAALAEKQLGTRQAEAVAVSDAVSVRVSPAPRYGVLIAIGALALAVVGGALALWTRSRARRGEDEAADRPTAREWMNRAQEHRLDGDFYACYSALCKAAQEVGASEERKRVLEMLETRRQDVGYRKARPTEDDLEGDFRALERLMRESVGQAQS
jgi:hypothetical protein